MINFVTFGLVIFQVEVGFLMSLFERVIKSELPTFERLVISDNFLQNIIDFDG